MTFQISRPTKTGKYTHVRRVVTERRGSWRWQDAFRQSEYEAVPRANGNGYYWKVVSRSFKFAKTKGTEWLWKTEAFGSLNHKPARQVVDDFGDLLFVVKT